jgi:hypothetical protein
VLKFCPGARLKSVETQNTKWRDCHFQSETTSFVISILRLLPSKNRGGSLRPSNSAKHHQTQYGASKIDKKTLRRIAMEFYINGEILYKRSFDGTLLRCLSDLEANKALQEVHEGICATHTDRHMMARQMQRAGYFWLSMEKDCINFV